MTITFTGKDVRTEIPNVSEFAINDNGDLIIEGRVAASYVQDDSSWFVYDLEGDDGGNFYHRMEVKA